MNRRQFIRAAASSVFIGPGLAAAGSPAALEVPASPDRVFYDERFAEARRLAAKLAASARLTPVRGDITDIWNAGLDRACARSPLTLQGVTTESFWFCLKIMAGSKTGIDTSVRRVDRDLFLWTIRTNGGNGRMA